MLWLFASVVDPILGYVADSFRRGTEECRALVPAHLEGARNDESDGGAWLGGHHVGKIPSRGGVHHHSPISVGKVNFGELYVFFCWDRCHEIEDSGQNVS
jgi:hypothetical protein